MTFPTFKQTKFLLAAFIIVVATILVLASLVMAWLGKPPFMTTGEWWAVGSTILALYGAGHITDTHLQQKKQIAPADQVT
jgi:hypothetical protein